MTSAGTLVVSYSDDSNGSLVVARSADGSAFTQVAAVESGFAWLAYPCAAIGGRRLWLVYVDAGGVELRWSDDDGQSWPAASFTKVSVEADVSSDDPTCAGTAGDLFIAYSLSKDTTDPSTYLWKDYGIRVAHSSDGGATIDEGQAGAPDRRGADRTPSGRGRCR